jgi:hypothetical protein
MSDFPCSSYNNLKYITHLSPPHLCISTQSVPRREHAPSQVSDYEETEKWVVVRDTTGGGEQNLSSVWKVPRHCPFVLLVIVAFSTIYKHAVRTSQGACSVTTALPERLMLYREILGVYYETRGDTAWASCCRGRYVL